MPPPSSSQQKVLAAQFVALTGASERQATKYLKSTGYKINEAVDADIFEDVLRVFHTEAVWVISGVPLTGVARPSRHTTY